MLEYADIESIAHKNLVDLVTGNADVAISQYYMLDNCHRISAINAWDYDISYGIQPPKFDFSYNQIMSDHATDSKCESEIMEVMKTHCKHCKVKSRTLSGGILNIVVEYNSANEKACTDAIEAITSVTSVSTLSHDGDITF